MSRIAFVSEGAFSGRDSFGCEHRVGHRAAATGRNVRFRSREAGKGALRSLNRGAAHGGDRERAANVNPLRPSCGRKPLVSRRQRQRKLNGRNPPFPTGRSLRRRNAAHVRQAVHVLTV